METKVNVKITKLFFFSSTSHLHTLSVWICREQSQWVCKINTDFVEFVHLMCRNGCKIDQLAIGSQSLDTYICAMWCVNWFQCSSQSLAARMVAMKKNEYKRKRITSKHTYTLVDLLLVAHTFTINFHTMHMGVKQNNFYREPDRIYQHLSSCHNVVTRYCKWITITVSSSMLLFVQLCENFVFQIEIRK